MHDGKSQYGAVHLCFTSRVSEELLKLLYSNKYLAPRVLSFQEINLDFYFFNDNVFHLGRPKVMPLFKIISDEAPYTLEPDEILEIISSNKVIDMFVTEMANRLFTVCAIFHEFPYVQYQGSS